MNKPLLLSLIILSSSLTACFRCEVDGELVDRKEMQSLMPFVLEPIQLYRQQFIHSCAAQAIKKDKENSDAGLKVPEVAYKITKKDREGNIVVVQDERFCRFFISPTNPDCEAAEAYLLENGLL